MAFPLRKKKCIGCENMLTNVIRRSKIVNYIEGNKKIYVEPSKISDDSSSRQHELKKCKWRKNKNMRREIENANQLSCQFVAFMVSIQNGGVLATC